MAFRIFKDMLEKKYGKEGARERIYATTDKARGALKGLADAEGYETFVVPDDVGGRYSVLTAVGLLPIAAAGIDIDALMGGARKAMDELQAGGLDNPAWKYAAARHALYESGKKIELLACYEPRYPNNPRERTDRGTESKYQPRHKRSLRQSAAFRRGNLPEPCRFPSRWTR